MKNEEFCGELIQPTIYVKNTGSYKKEILFCLLCFIGGFIHRIAAMLSILFFGFTLLGISCTAIFSVGLWLVFDKVLNTNRLFYLQVLFYLAGVLFGFLVFPPLITLK